MKQWLGNQAWIVWTIWGLFALWYFFHVSERGILFMLAFLGIGIARSAIRTFWLAYRDTERGRKLAQVWERIRPGV